MSGSCEMVRLIVWGTAFMAGQFALTCFDAAKVKRAVQIQQEGLTTIAALDSGSTASLYRPNQSALAVTFCLPLSSS